MALGSNHECVEAPASPAAAKGIEIQALPQPTGRADNARLMDVSPSVQEKSPPKLPHLTGLRTLVALWIVCHHMAPKDVISSLSAFVMRVDVAVEFFVLLSGFVTHYSYCDRDFTDSFGSLMCFYARRLARVVVTAQIAILSTLLVNCIGGFSWSDFFNAHTIGCLFFVKTWLDPEPNCPNGPTWFVASLIPSWLLYPLMRKVLVGPQGDMSRDVLRLCAMLWSIALGPQLLMIVVRGSWLKYDEVKLTWFWPPALLADFAFGCCVAALVVKAPLPRRSGMIADLIAVFVLTACLMLPVADTPADWSGPVLRPGHFMAWDGILCRVLAVFLAAFIYFSANGGSAVARLLSHPALTSLGAYTLEVYLFQSPLHDLFVWGREALWLPEGSVDVFMLYLLVLWLVCILYVDLLAAPASVWLQDATAEWIGRSVSSFLSGTSQAYVGIAERERLAAAAKRERRGDP